MGRLLDAMHEMLRTEDIAERIEAERRFTEVLTFSSFNEIVEMLDTALANYWIEFPVWARNLAFRLASLLQPHNAEIRRRAAADLRCFGPDWDAEADRLVKEAETIERTPSRE
jgi:hypothetical protein